MLPELLDPASLEGSVAVVIDVLRASTTIIHAFANGAAAVIPCATVDEARDTAARLGHERVLLGGERHGQLIAGFDLDNSPLAYTSEVVAGRTIVFTTTNGTRALQACRSANCVLIGAFVNRRALVESLRVAGRPVHLVCAGTDGQLTAEDILFAGAIAQDLHADHRGSPTDVQTQMALDFWRAHSRDEATYHQTIRESRGGQNLVQLRLEADIRRCAERDLFSVVPEWSPAMNEIRVALPPA